MIAKHNFYFLEILFALLLCLTSVTGQAAAEETHRFDNSTQEERYKKLIAELRCLVCQNQNVADSNAELAYDMRRKTYEMVTAGKSENEIIDFMVTRYGDFVMYRPPLKLTTALLWFAPLLLLFIALIIVFSYLRKQKKQNAVDMTEQQQQQMRKLLDE